VIEPASGPDEAGLKAADETLKLAATATADDLCWC